MLIVDSRQYQNILHFVGIISSLSTISGAVLIGGGKFYGILLMIFGAICTRITSEIEFTKMGKLMEEKNK